MEPFHFEKREFIRIPCEVPVRYKFLSRDIVDRDMDAIHDGSTQNIGAGGMLLTGKIPKMSWLPHLLTHKIFVGLNLYLPVQETPIKSLTRVIWVEAFDEKTGKCSLGLQFRDIITSDHDKVIQFVIKSQIRIT